MHRDSFDFMLTYATFFQQDMHYAEFGEDEVCTLRVSIYFPCCRPSAVYCIQPTPLLTAQKSAALLAAIREYDANKWKVIGQKVGKPAKVTVTTQPLWSFATCKGSLGFIDNTSTNPNPRPRRANNTPKSTLQGNESYLVPRTHTAHQSFFLPSHPFICVNTGQNHD
jgi:hypothetical protein